MICTTFLVIIPIIHHMFIYFQIPHPVILRGNGKLKKYWECLAPLQSTDETQIFVLPASALVEGTYPLVNIQKAIENGHRNTGFTH